MLDKRDRDLLKAVAEVMGDAPHHTVPHCADCGAALAAGTEPGTYWCYKCRVRIDRAKHVEQALHRFKEEFQPCLMIYRRYMGY